MEAIKAIAKRMKTGKYTIDLPVKYNEEEVEVMLIVESKKTTGKKKLADFAGKLQWKGDAVAYQKMLRDEWQ